MGKKAQVLNHLNHNLSVRNVGKKAQVLNHLNHNLSSFGPSSDDVGSLLNSLNIKLIMADKEEVAEGKKFLLSLWQARELRNMVFNVNYEKGLRG